MYFCNKVEEMCQTVYCISVKTSHKKTIATSKLNTGIRNDDSILENMTKQEW